MSTRPLLSLYGYQHPATSQVRPRHATRTPAICRRPSLAPPLLLMLSSCHLAFSHLLNTSPVFRSLLYLGLRKATENLVKIYPLALTTNQFGLCISRSFIRCPHVKLLIEQGAYPKVREESGKVSTIVSDCIVYTDYFAADLYQGH